LGDFLTLLFAAVYAFYVTLLEVRIQQASRVNLQLHRALQHPLPVTSWVDPPFTGVETFKLSSGGKVVNGLLVNVRGEQQIFTGMLKPLISDVHHTIWLVDCKLSKSTGGLPRIRIYDLIPLSFTNFLDAHAHTFAIVAVVHAN